MCDNICKIFVSTYEIPPDVWRHLTYDKNVSNLDCDKLDFINATNICSYGNGIVFKYNNKYYVITCYHIIKTHHKRIIMNIKQNDKINSYILNYVGGYPELDISLLEIENFDDHNNLDDYYDCDFNSSQFNISHIDNSENCYLKMLNTQIERELERELDPEIINYKIKQINIENRKIIGNIIPSVPVIRFKLDLTINNTNNIANIINYSGFSGSSVMLSNNIIGIVSSVIDDTLEAIPLYILYKFSIDIINHKPLKSIRISTDLLELSEKGKQFYGHHITNGYNISYKTNKKQNIILKDDFIIIKINDIEIKNTGLVYFSQMGIDVLPISYFILNNKEYVKLEYYSIKNKKTNIVNLKPNNMKSLYNINIADKYRYVKWNNLIFTELSEEFLLSLAKKNIIFNISLNYKNDTEVGKKYVILLDIINNTHNIRTPFSNPFDILILQKFGSFKISNLEELIIAINRKQTNITTLKFIDDNNNVCKLEI